MILVSFLCAAQQLYAASDVVRTETGHLCERDIMRLVKGPLHVVHTSITVRGNSVEEVLAQVQVRLLAATAPVNDSRGVRRAISAGDRHSLAAERVVVGVAGVDTSGWRVLVEQRLGDGYDVVASGGSPAAGAHAGVVPGQVAGVVGSWGSGTGQAGTAGACGRGCSWCGGAGGGWCDVGACWRDVCAGGRDVGAGWRGRDVDRRGAGRWRNVDGAGGRGLVAGRSRRGGRRFDAALGGRRWVWLDSHGALHVRSLLARVAVVAVMRLGGRDALAWVHPNSGRNRNSNNRVLGLGDPGNVALVGHRHSSNGREERASGEHVLGVHLAGEVRS